MQDLVLALVHRECTIGGFRGKDLLADGPWRAGLFRLLRGTSRPQVMASRNAKAGRCPCPLYPKVPRLPSPVYGLPSSFFMARPSRAIPSLIVASFE
jgi:hypothetical protein